MNTQLSLPGFDASPKPIDRLFFAALPDEAAIPEIRNIAEVCDLAV